MEVLLIIVIAIAIVGAYVFLKAFDQVAGRGPKQVSDGIYKATQYQQFSSIGKSPDNGVDKLLDEETKICPECAETIKLKSKKCRFCGEQFDPEEITRLIAERIPQVVDREGKVLCPQCGTLDVYKTMTKDHGYGDWCPNCKESLKSMVVT
ncbi:MAG: hypothetical protein H8D45_00240 [Bacteroidetes bacterium]|nr:hypothetical protein [Bacteroidota bacterium]